VGARGQSGGVAGFVLVGSEDGVGVVGGGGGGGGDQNKPVFPP